MINITVRIKRNRNIIFFELGPFLISKNVLVLLGFKSIGIEHSLQNNLPARALSANNLLLPHLGQKDLFIRY